MGLSTDEKRIRRLPPQDLDSEAAVLGCCLLSRKAMDQVLALLEPDDFYKSAHSVVFEVMLELGRLGIPVDIHLVQSTLKDKAVFDKIGGLAFLSSLLDAVSTPANSEFYAAKVREKAQLRGLLRTLQECEDLVYSAQGHSPASEIVEEVEGRVFEATRRRGQSQAVPLTEIISDVHAQLADIRENGAAQVGLQSGFDDLDHKTRGFHPGELTILAARPSMGKTSLALCFMRSFMTQGASVALFSIETPRWQIGRNLLSQEGGINGLRLRGGFLSELEEKLLMDASERFFERDAIFVDDDQALTLTRLRSEARRLKAKHDIRAIVIDYLQLLRLGGQASADKRYVEVGEISRGLKQMARDLSIPVIALCQLNRKVEERSDKRPLMSDLREGGGIEQDADAILLLHRPHYYDQKEPKDLAKLILAKNRNGPTGEIALAWEPSFMRFENADALESPQGDQQ